MCLVPYNLFFFLAYHYTNKKKIGGWWGGEPLQNIFEKKRTLRNPHTHAHFSGLLNKFFLTEVIFSLLT